MPQSYLQTIVKSLSLLKLAGKPHVIHGGDGVVRRQISRFPVSLERTFELSDLLAGHA